MSEYTTPGANETEWPTLTITARQLREDDFIPEHGQFVKTVKTGTAYTHVVTRDQKKLKFGANDALEIERETLTEAAEKIRSYEYAVRGLTRKLEQWRERGDSLVVKAFEEANERMLGDRRYRLGSQLDYLMDVAVQRLRADLRAMAIRMHDDEDSATYGDVAATFLRLERGLESEIIEHNRYGQGPLSRSTSLTSNLAEDLEVHEKRRLLEDIQWEMMSIKA